MQAFDYQKNLIFNFHLFPIHKMGGINRHWLADDRLCKAHAMSQRDHLFNRFSGFFGFNDDFNIKTVNLPEP